MSDSRTCFSARCFAIAAWALSSEKLSEEHKDDKAEEFFCGRHLTSGLHYASDDELTVHVRWVGVW